MTGPRRGVGRPVPSPRPRLNLGHGRYHARDIHPHVTNALLHLGLARRAARRRDRGAARLQYARSLRCWRHADAEQAGRWRREVLLVAQEYVAFAADAPRAGDPTEGRP